MGDAGRETVRLRFDWPVIARLHHELYLELADRRRSGLGGSASAQIHPLRADPFRDFAPFATSCLGPETMLRLSLPLNEVYDRLNNLTYLDRFFDQLHASPSDLQRLLAQLESEGSSLLHILLQDWPAEQHDALTLSLTWLAKLGCIHWSDSTQTL